MSRARPRSGEALACSIPHVQKPGWRGTGGTLRASRQNNQRGARLRTARDTGVEDHRSARGLSPGMVAMRADPADARCGTEGDVVYVRVSGLPSRSPVGDESLGCLQDVLWLGGDHLRWRLIVQVGIHPTEPRADSLGLVVLDE